MFKFRFFLSFLAVFVVTGSSAQSPAQFAFSSVNGFQNRAQKISLGPLSIPFSKAKLTIAGADAAHFKLVTSKLSAKNFVSIEYRPPAGFAGMSKAQLDVSTAAGKKLKKVLLNGIATKALEGENEPALSTIVSTLGYKISPGWTTLANHAKPEEQGEEISAQLFKRAKPGKVIMKPIARYSPDFELSFGYYTNTGHAPVLHRSGVLAKSGDYVQHQTLYPELASGTNTFDPGSGEFGFFSTGLTHTAYSEDVWNMTFFPDNAVRATRIYPAKDAAGKLLTNTYLVCFEEAANGDYNDYVFLVENITPVTTSKFESVFNGKDLTGFHTYLQKYGVNKDPDGNFRVEDGVLHVIGKDLGYAISDKGYTDFHIKVDFKWGETKWPPRQNAKRDGGLLYNIGMSEPDSIWPTSIECQIQEGDCGDFWMLGFSTLRVNGKVNKPTNHIGVVKKRDGEKPYGEWNTIEVVSYQGKCIQIVNGIVVNYGDNASAKGGRFCLQSEYAEIYYRNVKIRGL